MAKTRTRAKTRVKAKTSVRTRIALALAGGAILAAAAAGVYQVDKATYSAEDSPRQEVVTVAQEATVHSDGPGRTATMLFSVNFQNSVDIPAGGSVVMVLPEGLSANSAVVSANIRQFGDYSISKLGRSIAIVRDGDIDPLFAGAKINIGIENVLVTSPEYYGDKNIAVAIQYMETPDRRPDFFVEDIYLEDNDVVTAYVGNKGYSTRDDNFSINIEAEDGWNITYRAGNLSDQDLMKAGGTTKLQPRGISQDTRVAVCIDSDSEIDEASEENNCLVKKLIVNNTNVDSEDGGGVIISDPIDQVGNPDTPDQVYNPDTPNDPPDQVYNPDTPNDPPEHVNNPDTPDPVDVDEDGALDTTNLIEVIAPNGGEIFTAGDVTNVAWIANNRLTSIAVRLLDGDVYGPYLAKTDRSDSIEWIIPDDILQSNAHIVVTAYDPVTGQTVSDHSDRSFSIVGREDVPEPEPEDRESEEPDTVDNEDSGDAEVDTSTTTSGGGGGSGGGLIGNRNLRGDVTTPTVTKGFNNLIKMKCPAIAAYDVNHPCRTVYYHSRYGTRHAFPNEKVFFSWYDNFDDVRIIEKDTMSSIPLAPNVTYKPGVKMVKFQLTDVVYAVSRGGVLRAIDSEPLASHLYGATWNREVDDINDAFYSDYTFGAPIMSKDQYSVKEALQSTQFINDSL